MKHAPPFLHGFGEHEVNPANIKIEITRYKTSEIQRYYIIDRHICYYILFAYGGKIILFGNNNNNNKAARLRPLAHFQSHKQQIFRCRNIFIKKYEM